MTYLSVTDLRGRRLTPAELSAALPRAELDVDAAISRVRPVVEDVAHRGAPAVQEASERFDGVRPEHLRVPQGEIDRALAELDPRIRSALEDAIARVRTVSAADARADERIEVVPGGWVTQRWIPVHRVGVYTPGGLAVLPSTVIMNVVPAQVAGVQEIVLASPPQKDHGGLPHPTILAACALLGITEVIAAGGAQGIALLAHGAPDLEDGRGLDPVDLVTGPGNVYVTAAKRLVSSRVGIDAEAGPTEILILADDSATPRYVAADLVSEAEHDPLAASVLVTDSEDLLAAVEAELSLQVEEAQRRDVVREALAGRQSGAILVEDLERGVEVTNAYGSEHVEVMTRDASALAARVRSAGAIFVGDHSPVALGDYAAGSNHVLPTGGTARSTGGLGVQTFLRGIHVVEYDREALAGARGTTTTMANAEGLPAHGRAVDLRFED